MPEKHMHFCQHHKDTLDTRALTYEIGYLWTDELCPDLVGI